MGPRPIHDFDNGVEASLLLGQSSIDGFREGSVDNPGISTGTVADRRSSEYLDARGNVAWQINPRNWVEGGFEWTTGGRGLPLRVTGELHAAGRRSLLARSRHSRARS